MTKAGTELQSWRHHWIRVPALVTMPVTLGEMPITSKFLFAQREFLIRDFWTVLLSRYEDTPLPPSGYSNLLQPEFVTLLSPILGRLSTAKRNPKTKTTALLLMKLGWRLQAQSGVGKHLLGPGPLFSELR